MRRVLLGDGEDGLTRVVLASGKQLLAISQVPPVLIELLDLVVVHIVQVRVLWDCLRLQEGSSSWWRA